MHTLAPRQQVLPTAIAATLLTALLVLFPAHRAAAHDELVSSDPAAGSTVETLPEEMTLTFSAALIDSAGGTGVVVMDAAGNDVAAGAPEIDGAVLIQPLDPDAGTAGEYTVVWQVVSSDGHPTDGEFTFTMTGAATPEPTTTTAPETTAPEQTPSATPSATPEVEATQAPSAEDDSAPAWIWPVAIIGILALAAIVTWLVLRSRRGGKKSDSDMTAEG